jgi:hypothetical protein
MNKKINGQFFRMILGLIGFIGLILLLTFSTNKRLPAGTDLSHSALNNIAMPSLEASPDYSIDQEPATPIPVDDSPFIKRDTRNGWITESGLSPYSSQYIFTNQWFAQIADQTYIAFAGSLRSDMTLGGKQLDRPWPSIIVLEVRNDKGEILSKVSSEYRLPANHGMLRILDAGKDSLFLVAEDGQLFSFDLETRTFKHSQGVFTKPVSKGFVNETSMVPYPSEKYYFINYWSGYNEELTMYVYGGCMKDDPFQGVVVKIIKDKENNIIESTGYLTPVQDGCVRIVDMEQDNLIFVTLNGVALAFNPINNLFFDFSEGYFSSPFDKDQLISLPYDENPPLDTLGTATPAPTLTPLPTYNPYP